MKKNLKIIGYSLMSMIFLLQLAWAAEFIPQNSNRVSFNYNTNWKWFNYDVANGQSIALDESGAQNVCLPHSNTVLDLFDVNPSDWQYVSWYRRHFTLSSSYSGRRVLVEFQAAGQINKVYVNGYYVGEGKGHFTSFTLDITDYVIFGNYDNLLAVQVDNTPHSDTMPYTGDFYLFGGIHGDAKLIVTDSLAVDSAYYWTEKNGTGVNVKAKIVVNNQNSSSQSCTVTANLVDTGNNLIASVNGTASIAANSSYEFNLTQYVASPRLWTINDPYLYTMKTQVQKGSTYVDQHDTNIGLRWVYYDAKGTVNGRFYLNDQPLKLFGANKHMQHPYLGNAGPNRLQRRDAQLLKYELGCNFVRTSHYTNDPEFLEECDKIGLLVEEECLGWGTLATAARPQFEYALQEMVKRDRNHPAIFMWSVMPNEETADNATWHTNLHNMAKGLDPSRPTVMETCNSLTFVTDVYAHHDYSAPGTPVSTSNYPYMVGEYNDQLGKSFVIPNDCESRKVDQLIQETIKMQTNWESPKVAGFARWDSFGYLTPQNTNGYGKNMIDYRCAGLIGVYKDPLNKHWLGYQHQAQADPSVVGYVLYICNEWKSDSPSTVYVASNCNQVELLKNGVSLGRIAPNLYTGCARGLFQWTGVTWSAGSTLAAKGYDAGGALVKQYTRYASSYNGANSLVLNATTGNDIMADGTDVAWIIAQLKDSNGQRCYYEDGNLKITTLTGPGEAVYKKSPLRMTDGLTGFYVRSKLGQTGTINVQAKVDLGVSFNDSITGTGQNQFEYYPPANWSIISGRANCYNQDQHYSNSNSTANDYLQFRFTGTQIRLYGEKGSSYGQAAVSIDGGAETTVDYFCDSKYGSIQNQLIYESPALTSGTHTFKVRVTLTKNSGSTGTSINVDRVKVLDGVDDLTSNQVTITASAMTDQTVPTPPGNATPPPGPTATPRPSVTTVNDSVTGTGINQFEYYDTPHWTHSSQTGCYNGDNTYANMSRTASDYMKFRFLGTQIKLYGSKASNHGIAAVSIDGGAETDLDYYASARQDGILLYTSPVLADGYHELKARVKMEKNTAATGYCITADRVDVLVGTQTATPTPTPGPTLTPTPTPTPTALFSDNFEDGNANGWTAESGSWSVVSDGSMVYKQSTATGGKSFAGSSWSNYSLEAKIKALSLGTNGCTGLSIRYTDSNNRYFVILDKSNNIYIKKASGGTQTVLASKAYTITIGTTYTVKFAANGSTLEMYVNGVKELTATDTTFSTGKIALNMYNATGEFDDIVVNGF